MFRHRIVFFGGCAFTAIMSPTAKTSEKPIRIGSRIGLIPLMSWVRTLHRNHLTILTLRCKRFGGFVRTHSQGLPVTGYADLWFKKAGRTCTRDINWTSKSIIEIVERSSGFSFAFQVRDYRVCVVYAWHAFKSA